MTDKQEIDVTKCIHFDKSDIPNGCKCYWDGECNHDCYYKQLKRKEQELQQAMDNYVQLDLQRVKEYNELVDLHKAKEQECEALQMSENEAREIIAELKVECEELRRSILKIFACLIKANKDKIIDTLWVDNVTTLWDYAALTLGVEGDQMQIEKQILQKISEVLDDGQKQD